MKTCASTLLLVSVVASATALRIPFRRADSTDAFKFMNVGNDIYVGTLYVDGVPFEV